MNEWEGEREERKEKEPWFKWHRYPPEKFKKSAHIAIVSKCM